MIPLDRFFDYPDRRRPGFDDFEDDEYSSLDEEEEEEVYEYDDFASEFQVDNDE